MLYLWLILFIFLIEIERKLVLLSVLKEPVSRSIFDYALRSKDITSLFRHLHMRQKKRNGSLPDCPPPEDPAIAQLLQKLLSQVVSLFRNLTFKCRCYKNMEVYI